MSSAGYLAWMHRSEVATLKSADSGTARSKAGCWLICRDSVTRTASNDRRGRRRTVLSSAYARVCCGADSPHLAAGGPASGTLPRRFQQFRCAQRARGRNQLRRSSVWPMQEPPADLVTAELVQTLQVYWRLQVS